MFKTTIATCFVLAAASVGCASASDHSTSSAEAEAVTASGKVSLEDGKAQVAAVRGKYEPDGAHELLFNTSLAPAYLADVKPIFERIAPTDTIPLAGDAFTYVSREIQSGAVFGGGFFDEAIPAAYQDLWDYSFYFGGLSSRPGFWSTLAGLAARSKDGPLTDLQVLEMVTRAQPDDIFGGLNALGWRSAPQATAANARALVDAPGTFGALSTLLFGAVSAIPQGQTHDLDATNTVGVQLFEQTFSQLRFMSSTTEGEILVDLGGHLSEVRSDTQHDATLGIALATSVLTPAEVQELHLHLGR